MINSESLTVTDLTEVEVSLVIDYWYHSPPGFVESIGVDPSKLLLEGEMEKSLREKILSNKALPASKLNALKICLDGRTVGMHTLFPFVEGESGIFHAHIFSEADRRKGIAFYSYQKACRVFIDRFSLRKIVFKTPIQNTGAICVKQKLGIREVGEETIGMGIVQDGTKARVFEITREEIFSKFD